MDVDDTIEKAPPQEWLDDLAEAEAALAAGRGTPWPEARLRLRRLQASLKAGLARRQP